MKGGYPFNVRVYGLLLDKQGDHLLLSKEPMQEKQVTKFPGGGLQYGEGPEDCVVREFFEEIRIRVEVSEHFYTTGFFQPSFFEEAIQVISIYYLLRTIDPASERRLQKDGGAKKESFFWEPVRKIAPERFELPIDKEVARRVRDTLTP